jgi:phosphoserine phosphatase RsbU/P
MVSSELGDSREDPLADLLEDSAEDLYEHAPCGYLSTLPDGTIVKVNSTFLQWAGYRREDLVGRRTFQSLLAIGDRIFYETHYSPLLRMQRAVREIAVDFLGTDGQRLPALVNSVVRTNSGGAVTHIRTSVFDARQRREYERELLRARQRAEASETRARELARTLQASFIPPVPPAIGNLEIGAGYRPAGNGDEVGGDFYDVFATRDDEWVVVLGDVRGKGVEAARVTALARYTLRAAAMRERDPTSVLTTLNEALCRSEEDRFCTVAYASLITGAAGNAQVRLVLGGHQPPLKVDADGGVQVVGRYGDVVGVMDEPEFPEVRFDLRPGESLCFFTDGVTEGRFGDEYYGDERLAVLLSAHAHERADIIASNLVEDVVAFQHGVPRDDIAVVVLRAPLGGGA